MPDIFGRNQGDYELGQALSDQAEWKRYEDHNASLFQEAKPLHDFNALGSGVPLEHRADPQSAQAAGYLTNNLLAIQTMVDEVLYTAYRLPSFVHINTGIGDGARSYGIRVRDRVGRAQRITAPGFDAPSATVGQGLCDSGSPLVWAGC